MDAEARGVVLSSDTIAARATPDGPGAVAVVRLSGPRARELVRAAVAGTRRDPWRHPRRLVLGRVEDERGQTLDRVLVVAFPAPRSYTGEDLAEIHTHGGEQVVAAVLERLLALGARAALPGEFTRRAFENGRLGLDQAEAVARMVEAGTREELLGANRALAGELGEELGRIQASLEQSLARIEATLEFPDEGDVTPCHVTELDVLLKSVQELLGRVRRLAPGGLPRVVLAGRTNAGKSSIINKMVRFEASLVTPEPGTTRDALSVELSVGGRRLVLVDTAGREPVDGDPPPAGLSNPGLADRAAIRRTRESIEAASLVLWVAGVDEQERPERLEQVLAEARDGAAWVEKQGKSCLAVVNKLDLLTGPEREAARLLAPGGLFVSARSEEGLEALAAELAATLSDRLGEAGGLPVSVRQAEALRRVKRGLAEARANLAAGLGELAAVDLRDALAGVGQVRGQGLTPEVLDRIFEMFCIGK